MTEPNNDRWVLIRDMLIFQVKLGLDAIRDLLLSPVALVCVLIDLFKGHNKAQSSFHKLMAFGHKTDVWLNLFGTHETEHNIDNKAVEQQKNPSQEKDPKQNQDQSKDQSKASVDTLFSQVEAMLKEQHGKGGLTASAKGTIDRYLDKIVSKADVLQIAENENHDDNQKR